MLASASALEFEKLVEEDLGSVSASVGDLIAMDSGVMAIKSWDFGPSSITEEAVTEMLKESYFPSTRVKIPLPSQTIPEPEEGYAVVLTSLALCYVGGWAVCLFFILSCVSFVSRQSLVLCTAFLP